MDVEGNANLLERLTRFSEWHRMKKVHCLDSLSKTKLWWKGIATQRWSWWSGSCRKGETQAHESTRTRWAEKTILKLVQSGAFPKEIKSIESLTSRSCESDRQSAKAMKSEIKKPGTLYRPDLFLDRDEWCWWKAKEVTRIFRRL